MSRCTRGRMATALLAAAACALLGLPMAGAATLPSDDFNDNTMGDLWFLALGGSSSRCWVTETSGRLELRSTSACVDDSAGYLGSSWCLSTASDFAFRAQWHMSQVGAGVAAIELGVAAPNGGDAGFAEIDAAYDGGAIFRAQVHHHDAHIVRDSIPRSTTDGTFYISYNAALDRLHISRNGYWQPENPAAGDWVVDNVVRGTWGTDVVRVWVGGEAEEGAVLTSGEAWLDNFEVTQGTVLPLPFPISDDFNDNQMGDLWTLEQDDPTRCWVSETNQRLEVRSTSACVEGGAAYVGKGWCLSTGSDFSLEVQWHMSQVGSGDAEVVFGIGYPDPDPNHDTYAEIDAVYDSGATFRVCAENQSVEVLDDSIPRSNTDGTFYISYNAALDRLYLSVNDHWRPSDPAGGDWVLDNVVRGVWGADRVMVYLGGDVQAGAALASGEAWLDKFEVLQGVVESEQELPKITSFAINNGAASTMNQAVTLNNTCTGSPTDYMASEKADFSGASWQTYSTAPGFILSSGGGKKQVYLKVKNAQGETDKVPDTIVFSVPTQFPEVPTRCPPVDTVCIKSPTACPPVSTRCPAEDTQCPSGSTRCPEVTTKCPAEKTACPPGATKCPPADTQCPRTSTACPPSATRCPAEVTVCPTRSTRCPEQETRCPAEATVCPTRATGCPNTDTLCPAQRTVCPASPTVCHAVDTVCPLKSTRCPEVETKCPREATACPPSATRCPPADTQCPRTSTACPPSATRCPAESTQCPAARTACPSITTKCPIEVTHCPIISTKCLPAGAARSRPVK